MATHNIDVQWKSDLLFDAHQNNMTFPLASHESPLGTGASPKQLLLTSLAGCTAMDVASLLPKMRVPMTSLVVRVTGELTEEHPKVYTSMHMIYEVGTTEEYLPKVELAVQKSTEKYCGVHAMLGQLAKITHEIVLVG
jgi:putative redox protein